MKFIETAFASLFPNRQLPEIKVRYTNHFKAYNANVSLNKFSNTLEFGLSKKWRSVSEEIKIGLIQSLLAKVYKTNVRTIQMDLYDNFTKHLHISIPKTESDPVLEASFDRVNEEYFFNNIEIPNLIWGKFAKSTLGSYEYARDLITISSFFKEAPEHLLDYVMYHELLHKKHKFETKSNRSRHHTSKFREDEKKFKNFEQLEKEIASFLRYKRVPKKKSSWFTSLFR